MNIWTLWSVAVQSSIMKASSLGRRPTGAASTTAVIPTGHSTTTAPKQRQPTRKQQQQPQRHFVFGYGSLICQESRAVTNPDLADKKALPVLIQDVERVWSARTKTGMTAMGVSFRQGAECTGVLIEVNDVQLANLDKREANYDRRPIQLDDVEHVPFLEDEQFYEDDHPVFDAKEMDGNEKDHSVKVWIYIQRDPQSADKSHPIPQSYVDIIIRGCLSINEDFARSVIDTTKGWSNDEDNWVDDREVPIYMRADFEYSSRHGDVIDQILEDQTPKAYEDRINYDPVEHLDALADALKDDLAHHKSIKHIVKRVKDAAILEREEQASEI